MVTMIGVMSVACNLASVYYATKNSILTWLYGIIASILTASIFLNVNMLYSFLFQLFSALLCFLGLLKWKTNDEDNVILLNTKYTIFYLVLIGIVMGSILLITQNCEVKTTIDILLSFISIIATIMLLNHNIFAWIVFCFIDISYMLIATSMQDYRILILYTVMFTLAFYGFMINYFKYLKISGKENNIFD